MAAFRFMFIFVYCCLFVNGEVNPESGSNNVETHSTEIAAVLNYLNSTPVKVYNYKHGTLINAHTKADITELALDVSVDCINNYPDVPCTEKILICNAFVRGNQVLNDVSCKPKPEIIIEEPPYVPSTNPTELETNETESIALSNEAVSSEVGEHFVAVRRDSVPCLGCPFDLNPNAEGVDELVNLALGHVESERTNKQTLVKVLKVQQQVVSGVKYILLIEIAPTICSKNPNQESCPVDTEAGTSVCQIIYLHTPWISRAKHIISNNCTVSQEFVKPDAKKDEMNNEIDINAGRTKPAFGDSPNFDRIAESGTIEEMTPSRLEDLESQIFIEPDVDAAQPKHEIDEVVAPSTAQSEVSAIGNQPLIDRPTLCNAEETSVDPSQSPDYSETTPLASERQIVDAFVVAYYGSVDSENFPRSLKNETEETRPKRGSEESIGATTRKSEDSSSEEQPRRKRAIPQLEKISPEEKGLVKNLADFAAAALDKIDDDNHKRVILQILGAKKMVGDDGVYYHLIMRMGISRCLEDKPLNLDENCREKLFENYTKICKVQIYVNDDFGGPKIVKSQCQNIKRDKNDSNRTNYSRFRRAVLVGGAKEIDKDSEIVREMIRDGVTRLNAQSDKDNKYKPVEVVSASSQVVSGVLYRIKTKIALADCLNSDDKDFEQCGVLEGASPKTCELKVWDKPWLQFRQITITCDGDSNVYKFESQPNRIKRGVPGGEFDVSPSDEFVVKYLEAGLKHLDSESDHENKLKVHEIVSSTKQIVAGHIYRIKAKVVQSDCKKSSSTDRGQCGTLQGAQPKTCNFKIFEQLWTPNSRETEITCESDQKTHSFRSKRSVEEFQGPRLLGRDDLKVDFVLFDQFLKKFNKTYVTKKEYKYRLKVFSDNLKLVRVLNAYEQGTATYGVTQFADLTRKEFSKSLGLRSDLRNENEPPFAQADIPDIEIPAEFDWRQKGVVTEVKNQQQCGSCWAFSVTGNVEGQYAIKHGNLLEFSEQELVDCDTDDQGCNGGLMDTAYRAIEKMGGLETEQDYPYDAEDEKCHFNRSLARVQLSGAVNISHDETDMAKWLVANGPISIAINANAMQFYMGGVSHPFKFLCSPNNLDHGVLIVGYGVHTYPLFKKTIPYWIVKNSWGKSWGEQGYYRVYRGDGTCGLNQTPSSAIVA